jgi:predicted XRE-type DNA-binding protein
VILGLAGAEKLKIKTSLVIEIRKVIRSLGMTQQEVAKRMGIAQPKVADKMRGDFTNLSERKLMDCLTRLGHNIEIKVRPPRQKWGTWRWLWLDLLPSVKCASATAPEMLRLACSCEGVIPPFWWAITRYQQIGAMGGATPLN